MIAMYLMFVSCVILAGIAMLLIVLSNKDHY